MTAVSYRTARGRFRVLTGSIDYRLSEKWSLALFNQVDLRDNEELEQRLSLRHHGHDFLTEIRIARDEGDNDTSVSLSLTPILLSRNKATRRFSERAAVPDLIPDPR